MQLVDQLKFHFSISGQCPFFIYIKKSEQQTKLTNHFFNQQFDSGLLCVCVFLFSCFPLFNFFYVHGIDINTRVIFRTNYHSWTQSFQITIIRAGYKLVAQVSEQDISI